MNGKRKRKMKPGSTMYDDLIGKTGYVKAVEPTDDIEDNDETEINEMNFIEKINEAVNVGSISQKSRSGSFERVHLTTVSSPEVQAKSPDGYAWLTNENPLRITFDGDVEEYDVEPSWIMKENKKHNKVRKQQSITSIMNEVSDKYMGKKNLNEFTPGRTGGFYVNSTSRDVAAYDQADYSSPEAAYNEFKNTNSQVKNDKVTDMATVKAFIKDVYKGGDHNVGIKQFVKYLVKKGIRVTERKENKIANFDKVE
jgi:hypothetical protein